MANNTVDYGFMQLEDIYDQRVADVEPERIDSAVFSAAQIQAEGINAVMDQLVERTTARDAAFELPTSGELQPVSEDGTPIPTQGGQEIQQGYPMWRGADSFGLNRESYAKLTVQEMAKLMLRVEDKDARWMFRRFFASIFTNSSWTFKEKGRTDLTVRGLAVTADGSIYIDQTGELTTANHYTATTASIADDDYDSTSDNPYFANSAILRAHPANTGVIIHYLPPGLQAATTALTAHYPYNPNTGLVQFGADVDLAADSVGSYLGFGNEVTGVVGDGVTVVSRRLPANYIVSVVLSAEKPIVMREEPEVQLQGLQVVPFQVNSNFRKWDFYRKAGFAVRNPIAIAVRQLGAASYSIPTGYDASTIKG